MIIDWTSPPSQYYTVEYGWNWNGEFSGPVGVLEMWCVEAAQAFCPGAEVGESFCPGTKPGQVFVPGADVGQAGC